MRPLTQCPNCHLQLRGGYSSLGSNLDRPEICDCTPAEPVAWVILRDSTRKVHVQSRSHLFRLPPELRQLVYEFALQMFDDMARKYRINARYTTPESVAPRQVSTSLLLTCRAVYLESYRLPAMLNSLKFYIGDGLDSPLPSGTFSRLSGSIQSGRMKRWQITLFQHVDISLQQAQLEGADLDKIAAYLAVMSRYQDQTDPHFPLLPLTLVETTRYDTRGRGPRREMSSLPLSHVFPHVYRDFSPVLPERGSFFRTITRLTLRMRATDWWNWTTAPRPDDASAVGTIRLDPAIRWGNCISHWPSLTLFEMHLETFQCKKNQLEKIVEAARTWRFPLEGTHTELVHDGRVEPYIWRGAHKYRNAAWLRQHYFNHALDFEVRIVRWRRQRENMPAPPFVPYPTLIPRREVPGMAEFTAKLVQGEGPRRAGTELGF